MTHAVTRGVEHIGITVPDLDLATRFFVDAFGAELLFEMSPPGANLFEGINYEANLGVPPGTALINVRMLRFHDGPSLELFEYRTPDPKPAALPSDYGLQHFAVYVDDLDAVSRRIEECGGTLLEGPGNMVQAEEGPGNRWRYTRTPWGMTIELVSYEHMAYEETTEARRWAPAPVPGSPTTTFAVRHSHR